MRQLFIKNAIANLCRGGAAAVVAIILPPVLVRHLAPTDYAVWALVLQVVAYVGYLDFGLQTAIGRYIAFSNEKNDLDQRDGVFSTAFAGLLVAALLGLALILAAAALSHYIFPSVPTTLLSPMRSAMLIVGISVALGLPAASWNGVFVGLQRYEIPAITVGGGKLLSALGLILAALTGRSLVLMAIVVAGANVLSYVAQFVMLRQVAPQIHFKGELITRARVKELTGYCASLTVWSFSMLLVSGFDLILVGRFQFSAVVPYAVSATLITFLAGIQNAIFGVIMPHSATLHARQDSIALGKLLMKTTRLGALVLLLTGLPLIAFAHPLIGIWIGGKFAQTGGTILVVLMIANVLRLTAAPYASILIGTGQQRLVIVCPLVEGLINVVASVLLGLKYGANGVAWGTLIGAAFAVLANTVYNIQRTKSCISVSRRSYLGAVFAAPAWCGIPVYVSVFVAALNKSTGTALVMPALLMSCGLSAIAILWSELRRRSLPS